MLKLNKNDVVFMDDLERLWSWLSLWPYIQIKLGLTIISDSSLILMIIKLLIKINEISKKTI